MEKAAQPARRLDHIVAEARRLDGLLDHHNAEHALVLGTWLANGSQGERPSPAPETVGLHQRRSELDMDLKAAELALPGSREIEQQAASCAAAASWQLAEAIPLAAREAAAEVIEVQLIPAVEQVLRIEARLTGLVVALREAGDRPTNPLPGAVGISGQIAEMVRQAKREPGVPIAIDQARRFIDALTNNAQAVLK
jgi:hypothetical protein